VSWILYKKTIKKYIQYLFPTMSICVGYLDWFILYGNMLVYNCKGKMKQKKIYTYTQAYNSGEEIEPVGI